MKPTEKTKKNSSKVSSRLSLGERVPKLRFPGFEGEWESKKFGSLICETNNRTTKENEDILLSAAIEGMFLNSELFDHQRGISNKGYKKISRNTLILSTQNLHLGNANVNLRFEHGIVSPAYKTYDIIGCNHYLLSHWIKSEKAKKFFYDATTVGASLCRRNVEWETLYEQTLVLPNLDEQNHLANFLNLLIARVAAQRKLVELLKKHKRGLLDRIFERSKQTEKWEKYRLDQIAKINPSSESLPCEFFYIDLESVSDGVWHDKKVVKKESAPSRAQRVIQKNDILFQMVRPYQQNNLHITTSYDKPIVASTGYAQIRTSQNPSFIYWLLHSRTFLRKVLLRCTGSSYPAINSSDLKEIYVSIPPLEDQDQYARALNSISQKCNIEESLVCHLENLKSGLLQQMFV